MARAAKGAALRGLGRFLSTLAGGYEQDRKRREEEESSNRQFGQRVGEMTLRQYMEENSPSGQAALGKTQAEGRRLTAEAGQEEETLRRLQTGEPTVQQGIDQSKLDLGASEVEVRQGELTARQEELTQTKAKAEREVAEERAKQLQVESLQEWKGKLPQWMAARQYVEARIAGFGLTGNDQYDDWVRVDYADFLRKKKNEGDPYNLGSLGDDDVGPPLPSGYAPPAPGPAAASTVQLGSEQATAPLAPSAQPPADMGVTPPAQLSSPSVAAENTAGLDEADIIAVREAAALWGMSFNDARARLESRVGTPR